MLERYSGGAKMARITFRSVGTQTIETTLQIQGRMNRERALRRLVLKYKGPIKTFTDSDVRTQSIVTASIPARVAMDKLPVVKMKEGQSFTKTRDSKQWKYHSMAEYNTMRRNTKNYSHYRSQSDNPDGAKDELPVLKDQATNTETLMLRPYVSNPTPRPKTAALVGMPPVQGENPRMPRTARSAGMVVRREKINQAHTARTENAHEHENMHAYRLLGSGIKRKDESDHDPDQQTLEPEVYQQLNAPNDSSDKPHKTMGARPGVHLTQGRTKMNVRYLKFYSGSDADGNPPAINQHVLADLTRGRATTGEAGGRRVTFREDQNTTSIYFGNGLNRPTRGYVIESLDAESRTGNSLGPFALTEKNLTAFNKIQMKEVDGEDPIDEDVYSNVNTNKRVSDWVQQRRVQIPSDGSLGQCVTILDIDEGREPSDNAE